MRLDLPPKTGHAKFDAAVDAYKDVTKRLGETGERVTRLDESRHELVLADRQALADAQRSGKDDPGQGTLERHDAERLKVRRDQEALAIAASDARSDVLAAVTAHGDALAKLLEKRADSQRAQLSEAIRALDAAFAALGETEGLRQWLRDASAGHEPRLRPVAGLTRLRGLPGPNGEPAYTEAVLAALHQAAQPPQPATVSPHTPHGEQTWPTMGVAGA